MCARMTRLCLSEGGAMTDLGAVASIQSRLGQASKITGSQSYIYNTADFYGQSYKLWCALLYI
jgi:hypothetical protein